TWFCRPMCAYDWGAGLHPARRLATAASLPRPIENRPQIENLPHNVTKMDTNPPTNRRIRIRLRGIVQGVGCRPCVHNLALKLDLAGYVLNSSAGLVAEVEGDPDAVDAFVAALKEDPPPLAWIQEMEVAELPAAGEDGFMIRAR